MKLSRRELLGGIVAGTLAAIAGKLPKMAVLPVVEEVAQIEMGVGRGSPLIRDDGALVRANDRDYVLDWISPPTGYARACRDYAAALGRSVETLTKAEKQMAYLNHVMEKLG